MKKYFFLLGWILLVASCSRCKEDCMDATNPDCPNYVPPVLVDSCAGLPAANAAMFIGQHSALNGLGGDTLVEVSQFITTSKQVRLHALDDSADEYIWYLGEDTIRSRDYVFAFLPANVGLTVQVKLVVIHRADSACLGPDAYADTSYKYIGVKGPCDQAFLGQWYGAWDESPQDSFLVKINRFDTPVAPCYGIQFRGINGNYNDSAQVTSDLYTYNYLDFFGPDLITNARGRVFVLDDLNHVIIRYIMIYPENPTQFDYTFRGRRVQ